MGENRMAGRVLPSAAITVGCAALSITMFAQSPDVGREISVARHLEDGEEYRLSTEALLAHGRRLFTAMWTSQEGGGRPLTKGTGAPLGDPSSPLVFPRNFNRNSGPDANSCAGCHSSPFGIAGGSGDIVANVFVLGQRGSWICRTRGGARMAVIGRLDGRSLRYDR